MPQKDQILECTDEQLAAIGATKTKKVLRDVQTNDVDFTTGEIKRTTEVKMTISEQEPDYIKVYYRAVLAFNGITDLPISFLTALSSQISWASDSEPMLLRTDKVTKAYMCKTLGISESMFTKYITRCVKHGLLVKRDGFRGVYDVNPFFIAKGRWSDLKQLRTTFDYINHTWSRRIEETPDTTQDVGTQQIAPPKVEPQLPGQMRLQQDGSITEEMPCLQ